VELILVVGIFLFMLGLNVDISISELVQISMNMIRSYTCENTPSISKVIINLVIGHQNLKLK